MLRSLRHSRVQSRSTGRCDEMSAMAITTALLDLDGVIRHFDSAHVEGVSARYGIADG